MSDTLGSAYATVSVSDGQKTRTDEEQEELTFPSVAAKLTTLTISRRTVVSPDE